MKLLSLLPLIAAATVRPAPAADMFVYFGSHSVGPNIGFSIAHFDTGSGVLTPPKFLLEARAPAFFIIHPDGRHLYTCASGEPGGVGAYEINPKTGGLTLINRVLSGGGDASFITLDRTARFVLVANYLGGNISVFALRPDGGIGDWTAFEQHTGKSVDPIRQTHAYAHSIAMDPTNRFAVVADLGLDKVFVYKFDPVTGSLSANMPAFATVELGSGPRHVRFHPNGRWVYMDNEMASTLTCFTWDLAHGSLSQFQTISTLPAGVPGTGATAEMEVRPDGKYLYVSNRGDDSLSVFSIDPSTGRLGMVQHIPSGGKTPRNFAFDPTSRWMICTNHNSNNAVVFRVDEATGRLSQAGPPVSVPYPFCERFLPVAQP